MRFVRFLRLTFKRREYVVPYTLFELILLLSLFIYEHIAYRRTCFHKPTHKPIDVVYDM